MSNMCCVCSCVKRQTSHNIFEERMGVDKNAPLISEVLAQCVDEANYILQISSVNNDICKKCCEKLFKYYRTTEIAKQIRNEIIETLKKTKDNDDNENEEFHVLSKEEVVEVLDGNEIAEIKVFEPYIVEEVEDIDEECVKSETLPDDDIIDIDTTELEFITINSDNENQQATILENRIQVEENTTHSGDIGEDQTYEGTSDAYDFDNYYNNDNDDDYVEQIEGSEGDESGIKAIGKKTKQHESIKCPECEETFTTKKKLNAHTKRSHFAGYVCDHCGKTLYSYSGFTSHRQSHNPEKEFECNVCGAKYHTKVNLKHHLAWHSGEQPFECDICHKRFVHNIGLYKHKRIHDESTRRIECNICGFKFRTNAHLRRHMVSHTGTKAYSCPVCGKCFSQGYNMKAHWREHINPNSTRSLRMKCNNCTRTFTSKKNFEEHSKNCVMNEN